MSGLYRAVGRVVLGVATVSDGRRVHTLAATLTVAACVVSGCTDPASKPKPLPSSSTSASASASSSPSNAAPTMPPAAKGTSDAAAKAFVRHWIDVLDYSGPAGKSAPLRELATKSCIDCDAIADFIDTVQKQGGQIRGKGWTFLAIRAVVHRRTGSIALRTQVLVNPQMVVARRGDAAKKFSGGKRVKTFTLIPANGGWLLSKLDQGLA